nr:MAG TPA: hypothetical protein [Caudoviricetes sp.]
MHNTYVLICMVLKHIDVTWVYGCYVWNKRLKHWYRPLFVLGYAAWIYLWYVTFV